MTQFNSGATGSVTSTVEGLWDVDVLVNKVTSITCVGLPFFDPNKPMQGTKAARVR